jgi:hypothetical protein
VKEMSEGEGRKLEKETREGDERRRWTKDMTRGETQKERGREERERERQIKKERETHTHTQRVRGKGRG